MSDHTLDAKLLTGLWTPDGEDPTVLIAVDGVAVAEIVMEVALGANDRTGEDQVILRARSLLRRNELGWITAGGPRIVLSTGREVEE